MELYTKKSDKFAVAAFTLLETVIALGLGLSLLAALLSIYVLSVNALHSTETRSELGQNSRVIIERLTRDLRQTKAIASALPADDTDPLNPPLPEIELQDGHNIDTIQYLHYYLNGTDLRRQVRRYYFPSNPDLYVTFDAEDEFGAPPAVNIAADELAAEYVSSLRFYGTDLITIELTLVRKGTEHKTETRVFGRNL